MKENSKPEKKINQERKTKFIPAERRALFDSLIKAWTPIEKPEELIEIVKANPESILDDPEVQVKVRLLRRQYLYAPSYCAKEAKNTLQKIGLGDWLPKDLPRRRTNSFSLQIVKTFAGSSLPLIVDDYKDRINKFVHFPYGNNVSKLLSDVEDAFNHIYKKPMPKELLTEDHLHDLPSVALSFMAYEFKIPFYSLRKFYRSFPHFD